MVNKKHVEEITKLFAAFGQSSDGKRIATYCQYLADIPAEIIPKVCQKAVLECRYLPTIAELIESAQNIVGEAAGTNELPFADVWEEILSEIQRTYVWDKPRFSRKEIEQLVNAFGWNELKLMETRNVPTIRSQLSRMYDGILKRNRERRMNRYVLGLGFLMEADNEKLNRGTDDKIRRLS